MIQGPLYFHFIYLFLAMGALVVLPSCIPYNKVVKSEFPQGESYDDNREITYHNVRSTTVYDEFTTKGIFHALRLSDQARTAYVDVHCRKRGIIGEGKKAMLNRQLEENKHWISFYVLADIREKTYTSLSEKNSVWTVYLDVGNDINLAPESIKEVDLEPEYQAIFAHRFSLFKTAYLIKFPVTDGAGKHYDGDDVDLKLVVSSPYKKGELAWKQSDSIITEKLRKDEDFYWS